MYNVKISHDIHVFQAITLRILVLVQCFKSKMGMLNLMRVKQSSGSGIGTTDLILNLKYLMAHCFSFIRLFLLYFSMRLSEI